MKKIRIIGYVLILTGLVLNISILKKDRSNYIKEQNKIEYTLSKQISYREVNDTYDAILKIPKINLVKGIYTKNDSKNNIEDGVMIHKDSIYPIYPNSNVVLIGHSGSGSKAVFKDLDKLDTDSLIEFYYEHTKYIYKIDNIYCVDKNGTVGINKNQDKKSITLITCSQDDKSKQVVYIAYLIDEINY